MPGAWLCAGSGRDWLGLFPSLFAQPWGRPVMQIKAGIPLGSQLSANSEGRERGSLSGLSQLWRSHHACTAWPEMMPGSAHPSARLGDAAMDLGVPTRTLASSAPQLPPS